MTSPTVAIHPVNHANAPLLDAVDAHGFDNEVQPELLSTFLSNPANMLVVAVADDQVVGMASGIAWSRR